MKSLPGTRAIIFKWDLLVAGAGLLDECHSLMRAAEGLNECSEIGPREKQAC